MSASRRRMHSSCCRTRTGARARLAAPRARLSCPFPPPPRRYACERTRGLAHRLAVFCCALVLVPDVHRGAPWPAGRQPAGDEYAAWLSSLPPRRVHDDLRAWTIYLRADHRMRAVGLAGVGHGAQLALRALSADGPELGLAAGVALCPRSLGRDELTGLQAPVMCM